MGTEIEVPVTMHIEPETEPKKEVETPVENDELPDPRKDAMAEIYANRNKQIEKELETAKEISAASEPEPSEKEEEEQKPEPEAPATAPVEPVKPDEPVAPAAEPEQPQAKKYTLAVNGRQVEMDEKEVITAAQKVLSAGELFENAARMRKEAEMLAQQAPNPNAQRQPVQPHESLALVDDAKADEIIKKINYGSDLEQREAIRDLSATIADGLRRANNGPTTDQVIQIATQNALAQIAHQNNLAIIANEYKDIFASRPLTIAAADTVGQLRTEYAAKGIQKSDLELYRESCEQISKFLPKKEVVPETPAAATVAPSTPVQAATSTEKLERKRAAPQPPAAASKVATEVPKQKGYDPSTIVMQMRKSRGQSAYN